MRVPAALSVLFVLLGFLVPPPLAAAAAPPDQVTLEARVDAYFTPLLAQDLISGSVLIARGGEVLLAKGYGPADREHGVANGAETKFRLGSLTKQFTAAAVLLLEQRGLLRVDDPLRKYLPDFPHADSITIHQLLTHTSGLANYNDLPDYDQKYIQPLTVAEVIAWFKDQPMHSRPGDTWYYSNSNYVLLAAVIEKVSGKEYARFLREELFGPIGLQSTGTDVYTSILGNRAEGYVRDENGIQRTSYRDMPLMSGAGSLYSTVLDLYRWDRALRTDVPLAARERERLFTPVKNGYACGWFVEQRFGRKLISHGGAINGFLTDLQRFVDDDVTVIVLLNYESTFARATFQALGAIALGEPYKPALVPEVVAVSPRLLTDVAGIYRIDEKNTLTLAVADGILRAGINDAPAGVSAAQNDSTFFVRDLNAMLKIVRGPDGRVSRVAGRQGAHGFQATRER
jgi:CubicO group peptidase (beta-lactamase class C family)